LRFAAGANAVGSLLFPAALLQMLPARKEQMSYFGLHSAALAAMLLLNPIALFASGTGAALAFASAGTANQIINSGDPGTCMRAVDYAPLASLPRGRILAFIDAGPFILSGSEHEVFAAPYHRNQAGNIVMLDVFLGAPNRAKFELLAHDISYVAFCPGAPERYAYAEAAPYGLASELAKNNVPDFLKRIPLSGTDLVVYGVVK
jgi:hypothetical protein